ncbi:3'-5' RNA exonuclease complex component [Knufia peltigerae]|uniref:3'-5' RNA exonuclease complex component n=1 Tax=Knufia peltigerae TaxID=1002370 RepID=A0AA39D478_9EURO|nr:3'-5' RNA exonuclease complex component [Knufia peltigerae]
MWTTASPLLCRPPAYSRWRSYKITNSGLEARTSKNKRRQYHDQTGRRSSAEAEQSAPVPSIPVLESILGSESTRPQSPKSVVRDHLRTWTIQNKKKKVEGAEAQYAQGHRLDTLPNSLFIEETTSDEDTLEQDVDQLDDSVEATEAIARIWPGDLVYLHARHTGSRGQWAIYLDSVLQNQHRLFLSDGRWVTTSTVDFKCAPVYKNFASEEELRPIKKHLPVKHLYMRTDGIEEIPIARNFSGDIPHDESAALMQRVATLADLVLDFRRSNLDILDSLYERIAHHDAYRTLTYAEIYAEAFNDTSGDVPFEAEMSIYLQTKKDSTLMRSFSMGLIVSRVSIIPRRAAEHFEQVCTWAREYQEAAAEAALGKNVSSLLARNPLTKFIEKARGLILQSRDLRSPTTIGSLGPSSIQPSTGRHVEPKDTGTVFSEDDMKVLEFLWDCYARLPTPLHRNKNHSIGSLILRAIGAYPKLRLERKIGTLLLQELGVLTPWFEPTDQNTSMPLAKRRGAEAIDAIFAESERTCEELGLSQNASHALLQDSMGHLREDLGDMPVFIVDSAKTVVKDDGYSLEPHPALPDTYWIHVHIAHPTAFIDPDHIFNKRARAVTRSYYTPTTMQHMLPRPFTDFVSLGPGKPTVTVSTLIAESGEVLDIRVRPTRIHNTITLTPEEEFALLGKPKPERISYMIVGQPPRLDMIGPPSMTDAEVKNVEPYRSTLLKLEELVVARMKARRREVSEYMDVAFLRTNLKTTVHYVEEYDPGRLSKSYHYVGDPAITVTHPHDLEISRSTNVEDLWPLTAMLMQLACESAGKWFGDRDIPAYFSGSSFQPGAPLSMLKGTGVFDLERRMPEHINSTSPVPHVFLDVASYVRCTSPLRRYTDLCVWWQADAYLRAVANGLIKGGDSANNIELPFKRSDIEASFGDLDRFQRAEMALAKVPMYTWAIRALFRAFHFKEAKLPEIWDVVVIRRDSPSTDVRQDDTGIRGWLHPFRIPMWLLKSPEGWEKSVRPGSYIPVKLELVDLSMGTVYCKPVGAPSDTPYHSEPLQIAPDGLSLP